MEKEQENIGGEKDLAENIVRNNIYVLRVAKSLKYYLMIMAGALLVFFLSLYLTVSYFSFKAAMIAAIFSGVLAVLFVILPYKPTRLVSIVFNMLLMGFAVSLIYIKLKYSLNILHFILVTAGAILLFAIVIVLLLLNVNIKNVMFFNIIITFLILITLIVLIFTVRNNVFIYMGFVSLLLFTNAMSLNIFIFESEKFVFQVALANCISAFIAVTAVVIALALIAGDGCDCGADGNCCDFNGGSGNNSSKKIKYKIEK